MAQLMITGVEATQSTQIFQSPFPLCNGQPCPDNSIPLVADRRTILRVYVSGATPGNYVAAVMFPYRSETAPPEFPAMRVGTPIIAGTQPAQRLSADDTVQIDFLVRTPGTYRFNVLATEFDSQWNRVRSSTQTFPILLTFEERRRVRIRLVRIRYTNPGRNLNLAAPTVQDFWTALDFAHRVLPVRMPGFEIVQESEQLYDGDFTRIDPSAHDTNWTGYASNRGTTGNLLNIMDTLVAAESLPDDVIYIALYPAGANQSAFAGWAVSRWIISDGDSETLAHELAHQLCVPHHAPCGNPAFIDPNYPTYGTFPPGSIGEVGFDPLLEVTYNPATTRDLMTYCAPKWISPYNYRKVFDCLTPLPPPPAETPPLIEKINLLLVRFPDRWVKVDLPPIPEPEPEPPPFPFPPPIDTLPARIVVRDADGLELAIVPARLEPASLETDFESDPQQPMWLNAKIPLPPNAAMFEAQIEDNIVFETSIRGDAPSVDVSWPATDALREGFGQLTWTVKGEFDYIVVRTTCDGGESWLARLVPAKQHSLDLDASLLRSGTECMLEVVAVHGDRASRAVSQPFAVIRRPTTLLILSPTDDAVHSPEQPLRLTAISYAPDAQISWYSDLGINLGESAFITLPPLPPGKHVIEARSDQPFETPAQIAIVVNDQPPHKAIKGRRRAKR